MSMLSATLTLHLLSSTNILYQRKTRCSRLSRGPFPRATLITNFQSISILCTVFLRYIPLKNIGYAYRIGTDLTAEVPTPNDIRSRPIITGHASETHYHGNV